MNIWGVVTTTIAMDYTDSPNMGGALVGTVVPPVPRRPFYSFQFLVRCAFSFQLRGHCGEARILEETPQQKLPRQRRWG